jgi:hypothetical protein
MFTFAKLGVNMVEQIASFFSKVWALAISAIIYLVLCYLLLSGFVIMPLWALKLYIQNRRSEKLLRGEVKGIIDIAGTEMKDYTSIMPSWRGR